VWQWLIRPKARSDSGWPDIIGGCFGIVLGIVVWVFQGHDVAFRVAAVAVGVSGVREIVIGIIRRRELAVSPGIGSDRPAGPSGGACPTGDGAVGRHRGPSTLSEIRRLWREIVASLWGVVFAVGGFTHGLWWIGVVASVGTMWTLVVLHRRWREPGAGD
jgi:hypothetical protein